MNYTKLKPPMRVLNVAFDVSSETLNWSLEVPERFDDVKRVDGECINHTESIWDELKRIKKIGSENGFTEIRVICESTGIYHRSLLKIASGLGMRTNLVHGEAVAKYRTIRFADHGKTDLKDPQAILTVAKVGRLIRHRELDGRYAQLRELNRLVMRLERRKRAAKNELHADLRMLFPDLRLSKSVLYGPTGQALINVFGGNPHRLISVGFDEFTRRIKAESKNTKQTTLKRIWKAAEASMLQGCDEKIAEIQELGVRGSYAEIMEITERISELERRMQELYDQLREQDRRLPAARKGVISKRLLSRLVAEIGPPEDFQSIRQLTRYAGLNLCERQSGKWRGQTMISRRGRSELRYVLNLMALPLIRRSQLFGDYYWKKKEQDRMPGKKAITCVMRKILKMFFGLYRSEGEFQESRVFVMNSQYHAAA